MPGPRNSLLRHFCHPTSRLTDAAALVSGVLLTAAFAPFELFPLAILAPAALFLSWAACTPRRAAWRGFLFGLGLFGSGVSWVYVSMHDFGNMTAPLAALATLVFAALLALYPALLGWLQAKLLDRAHAMHMLLVLPALWVLFEWIRGWFLTGFPWLNLGYSQVGTPLAGYAPWAGVYGVSLACALSAGLVARASQVPEKILTRYLPILLAAWVGGWAADRTEWTHPAGKPVHVALIQGDVPLAIKWVPRYRDEIVQRYLNMSAGALDAQLIVWPEAAVPAYLDQMGPLVREVERTAREHGVDFVIGTVERARAGREYYNSVVEIGSHPGIYRKRHLVPFGEYLPLKPLFGWLLNYLQIPMSDFSAGGARQQPLQAAGERLGVSICYEDAFGEEVIRALPQATLLVNVSEDAWFGDSLAPHQRIQMARMRALETGRPMLRAANTGPSALIDDRGVVLASSPEFQPFVLRGEVQPMHGVTPYGRFGNRPVVLLVGAITLIGAIVRRFRHPRR